MTRLRAFHWSVLACSLGALAPAPSQAQSFPAAASYEAYYDRYFNMLDRWKADIMLHRDEGVPIWLGHRVASIAAE